MLGETRGLCMAKPCIVLPNTYLPNPRIPCRLFKNYEISKKGDSSSIDVHQRAQFEQYLLKIRFNIEQHVTVTDSQGNTATISKVELSKIDCKGGSGKVYKMGRIGEFKWPLVVKQVEINNTSFIEIIIQLFRTRVMSSRDTFSWCGKTPIIYGCFNDGANFNTIMIQLGSLEDISGILKS